jgi:hypothetical protein
VQEKRVTVWVQRFKDRAHLMLQWIDPDTGKRESKSAETDDPDKAETARGDLAGKVPAQVLRRLMRHADIKTTMGYYANVDDAVMEAVLGPQRNSSRNTEAAGRECRGPGEVVNPSRDSTNGGD